jgi:putative ABC transport system permease protein
MSTSAPEELSTRWLLPLATLVYFYRRRLRAHGTQELLAGVGIAAAVALVLAAGITQGSVASSTRRVLRAVVGPANLQLRARSDQGFPESTVTQVEQIQGVKQAAPLLERSISLTGEGGQSSSVYVAGTDASLGVLNGLGRTLPLAAFHPGTIALSAATASTLGVAVRRTSGQATATLAVYGVKHTVPVSTVMGREAVGVLAGAQLAVMPLTTMQQLLGQPRKVTRILIQTRPHQQANVSRELRRIAGGRLIVSDTEQDISQLEEALRPSAQASELFAIIGALLGFLLAFNAILLTVPERRQAIADLRLSGTTRGAIVQLTMFQAACLGVAATAAGLGVGYLLARWVFGQSSGYLAEAFAVSSGTVVPAGIVALAAAGGVLATCLASTVPLIDLRPRAARDAVYMQRGAPGNALSRRWRNWLFALALALAAAATVLYLLAPAGALAATVALALATVLAVPVVFSWVLAGARALSERAPTLSTLALALDGVRGTTLRSIALAATGAVALFGSVALGGARANLVAGIRGFAHSYAADAPIWVGEPADNQAVGQLAGDGGAARIAEIDGVASVRRFQGAFMTLGRRRVWVIARPPGGADSVLDSQTIGGPHAAAAAQRRLGEHGWAAVSQQIAEEQHVRVGQAITLPTPTGPRAYRVAALTSNLAWSPGVVFLNAGDFQQAWQQDSPSALAVYPVPGASTTRVAHAIQAALGPGSAVEVSSAATREAHIDTLTSEGLSQLGTISTLLVLAAVVALAAALASSINQRRVALSALRLAGAAPGRLRRILLVEGALMLGAGCLTGALAGIYGQVIIDSYLRHITGFPVAGAGASIRPVEILAVVLAAALAAAAIPGWLASRVSPALALAEE